MTRSLTNDVPGWGALFQDRVGDGTVSVSERKLATISTVLLTKILEKKARLNATLSPLSLLIQVMMATLLFIIPSKKNDGEMLMDWNKCKKLQWNIILLLGAGFAIAQGVQTSGLADVISANLDFLKTAPSLAIAPLVCLVSGTITEFVVSNNATTTLVLPLLVELAESVRVHPLLLMVPGAIGAQFAFLLPTATPSNIVGFTTGHIDVKDMIKTGVPLKIVGIAALTLLMPTLGEVSSTIN